MEIPLITLCQRWVNHYDLEMQPDRTSELTQLLRERILVLDGAMGTMVQALRLTEADFRAARFAGHEIGRAHV